MPLWKLDDGIHIGEIIKPHSYLGKTRVAFFISGLEDYLESGSFLFISLNEKPVPFLIEEIQWQDDKSAVIKLAGVTTDAEAEKLKRKEIYLPKKEIPPHLLDELDDDGFVGFEVLEAEDGNSLGFVTEILENGPQSLLVVVKEDKEILVPIHEDIIIEVNEAGKKLLVNLPEGLKEL